MKPVKISKKDIEEKFKEQEMMSTLPKKFRDKRLSLGLGKDVSIFLILQLNWIEQRTSNAQVVGSSPILSVSWLDNYKTQ